MYRVGAGLVERGVSMWNLGNGASVCLWDAADPRIRTLPWVFRVTLPLGPRER